MHYPLHITVLCTALWILRDDVNAAKSGVIGPEVLTSFAKNIASALSSTLLSEWQDSTTNQTTIQFSGPLKKSLNTHLRKDDHLDTGSKILEKSRDRVRRQAVDRRQSLVEDGKRFQDAYVTPDTARYPKHYNQDHYRFALTGSPEFARGGAGVGATENLNNNHNGNSIDGDINAAALRYQNDYPQSPGFKLKPELVPSLVRSSNEYLPYGLNPHYHNHHQTPTTSNQPPAVAGIDTNEENDDNFEPVRGLEDRYNLNYRNSYYAPHRVQFHNHPSALYPRKQLAENQPAPGNERDAENPSKLNEDQNPGQSVLGGYGYPPKFFYGPYHDGFYGPPYFYPGPYNNSFPHGDFGHPGGNYSGPFPHGPHGPHGPFHGFGPYFPYHPYHQNNNGKPEQPQNPPENAAQTEAENGNNDNQGNDKGSGNNSHDGHPFHGPFYGGGPFYNYPSFPIVPYKGFNPIFFDPLVSRIKPFPYLHVHSEPFVHFPLLPYYPFPKFYDHYGHPRKGHEKPQTTPAEQPAENLRPAESPENSDAEVISEGPSEIVESLVSDRQEFLFPWRIRSVKSVSKECSSDAEEKVSEE